jgi:hypothetical protein
MFSKKQKRSSRMRMKNRAFKSKHKSTPTFMEVMVQGKKQRIARNRTARRIAMAHKAVRIGPSTKQIRQAKRKKRMMRIRQKSDRSIGRSL